MRTSGAARALCDGDCDPLPNCKEAGIFQSPRIRGQAKRGQGFKATLGVRAGRFRSNGEQKKFARRRADRR